ncbi:RIP metalloprotease RseP [Vaginisenegalia massiliensis]|uniref:RIP metalloprotease RseP n=1 Tax=Vaginisenegalia massiliensis TaxID=2058294 RepID=UPI000F52F984|nr:RIP metalloprotease RseP [Vaginisenegalia massiliensis]
MKTLLVFLLIFSVIVVIHEFGHYYFARKAGILVREFSIGMGPKVFAHQGKDGTTYTLRFLPLGGYVRLAGLNEEELVKPGMEVGLTFNEANQVTRLNLSEKILGNEMPLQVDECDLSKTLSIAGYTSGQEDRKRFDVDPKARVIEADGTNIPIATWDQTYEQASVWSKIKTNFAGPMNNFILSIIVFTVIGFLVPGIPSSQAQIGQVIKNTPAAQAQLKAGDRVKAINHQPVKDWDQMVKLVAEAPDKQLIFELERGNQVLEKSLKIKAVKDPNSGKVYGQLGVIPAYRTDFATRLSYGFLKTWEVMTMVVAVVAGMFKSGFDLNQFGGPLAMAQMTGQVVKYGFISTLSLMGMLSANLGVFNLFPIPALDGGKIVLNLVELVRGKPLSQEKEGVITLVGVAILAIFMIAVTWNDIMRYFN